MSESDRSTVRREGTGLVAEYKFFFFLRGLDIEAEKMWEAGMDEDGRGRRREIRKMGLWSPFYTLSFYFFHSLLWRP